MEILGCITILNTRGGGTEPCAADARIDGNNASSTRLKGSGTGGTPGSTSTEAKVNRFGSGVRNGDGGSERGIDKCRCNLVSKANEKNTKEERFHGPFVFVQSERKKFSSFISFFFSVKPWSVNNKYIYILLFTINIFFFMVPSLYCLFLCIIRPTLSEDFEYIYNRDNFAVKVGNLYFEDMSYVSNFGILYTFPIHVD